MLAGLARRRPYDLRHTFAIWSLRALVPIDTLSREMGHERIEITSRTYGAWRADMGMTAAALGADWAKRNPGWNHFGTQSGGIGVNRRLDGAAHEHHPRARDGLEQPPRATRSAARTAAWRCARRHRG